MTATMRPSRTRAAGRMYRHSAHLVLRFRRAASRLRARSRDVWRARSRSPYGSSSWNTQSQFEFCDWVWVWVLSVECRVWVLIFTAHKRSLGQGNAFRSVYRLCMISFPIWLPGPMFLLGGGSLSRGFLSKGGVSVGRSCRNQKSWRYASYWNAFLLCLSFEFE